MKYIFGLIIGAIFGLGIALSGMINPAKVINFFDVFGTWDPSLIFVMGGALLITTIGYKVILRPKSKPIFSDFFNLPTKQNLDKKLIIGSAIFGIGWGMAGFCPGGAIPALLIGGVDTIIFIGAMILGIIVARFSLKFFETRH